MYYLDVAMKRSHGAKTKSSDCIAEIAQLGERQTEDLKVPGSIPGGGRLFFNSVYYYSRKFQL